MNKDNTDITVKILPTEQAHLEIILKIYELLLNMLYKNSEFRYNGLPGELELNVNDLIKDLTQKISELKTELENYKTKAPITKPASAKNIIKYSW